MKETSLLWTQPDWIAEAQAWIEQAVRAADSRLTGPVEQPHIRPWSTVMRAPTGDGVYFFKAAIPLLAGEPALTQALAARSPDVMPEIIAADTERGWMLTRDAGATLRTRLHSPDDLHLFDPILPRLAEVQMEWLDQTEELLALGAFDRRLETLPEQFERLAGDREALLVGQPDGLTEGQYEQLVQARPRYAEFCASLAEYGIPQSIHYDDMHDANIFLREQENGPARITFSDWGESCASHPFCSLLIFLRSMADRMGLPDEAAETPEKLPPMLMRLRDVYLEPWQQYESRANLVEAFNLAWRVGMVGRALTWHSVIQAMDEAFRPQYGYAVPAWLGEFLLTV